MYKRQEGAYNIANLPLLPGNWKVDDLEKSGSVQSGNFYVYATLVPSDVDAVSYTHLRAHETRHDLVCRLLLEKILQQHNQLNQGLSLKVMEINPQHKLIKKLAKMSKDKASISEVENISILLYEQSKILDGEKPSDPVEFSKKLIETITTSIN